MGGEISSEAIEYSTPVIQNLLNTNDDFRHQDERLILKDYSERETKNDRRKPSLFYQNVGFQIIKFLPERDVLKAQLITKECRNIVHKVVFWKKMSERYRPTRFPEFSSPYAARNFFFLRTKRIPAIDFKFKHVGDEYWEIRNNESDSRCKKIVCLKQAICDLDIKGKTFLNRGRYNFGWRIRFEQGSSLGDGVIFRFGLKQVRLERKWESWKTNEFFMYEILKDYEINEDGEFEMMIQDCGVESRIFGAHPWKKADPHYFSQTLDHFSSQNSVTFKQKYYEDKTYFTDPKGPVILYINGEGPCSGIQSWALEMYAKPLGALFVTLEHRFYGNSTPFPSPSVSDLQYLSSRQSLEDLANFRVWYEKTFLGSSGVQNKWIIIGGSYSGALSAWARSKYPHLYSGALSSSGVVNTIYKFFQFDEQIVESAGPLCAQYLRNGTREIETLISDPKTRDATMNKFNNAASLSDGDFLWMIADLTATPIQYGYQKYLCDCFSAHKSAADGIVDAFNTVFVPNGLGDVPDYDVRTLLEPNNNPSRMWWYQKCAEFSYFQVAPKTSSSIRSQSVNLEYHKQRCEKAYGVSNSEEFSERSLWHYGGISVWENTDNIYFTNGSQDPWKRATVQGTKNENEKVKNIYTEIKCENCGHCVDLYDCPGGCTEEKMVNQVRAEILDNMKKWIS